MTFDDPINHPSHYAAHYTHEVIELTSRQSFIAGNIWKYLLRSPYKGREREDLGKALWYARYAKEHRYSTEPDLETLELMYNFYSDLQLNDRPDLATVAASLMCEDWPAAISKLEELAGGTR